MMILVLGATGHVAASALPLLDASPAVSQLVMAGRDPARVAERRDDLAIAADVRQADATKSNEVAAAAAGCDVVINLAGLDAVTPLAASQGALEAGCHHVDTGASAVAVQTLLARSQEFASAGVACVPSIGGSPGLAGLLGCYAAAQLEKCESVTVNLGVPLERWGDPKDVAASYRGGAPVSQSHVELVALFSQPALVLRGGELEWIRPGDHPTRVTGPDGLSFTTMPVGSPEAVTIPTAVAGVQEVEARWGLWPEETMHLAARPAAPDALEEATRTLYTELATWDADRLRPPEAAPKLAFWAQAEGHLEGHLEGRHRTVRTSVRGPHFPSTAGIVCAAAILLGTDLSLPRGVVAPEACFEATSLLADTLALEGVEPAGAVVGVQIDP